MMNTNNILLIKQNNHFVKKEVLDEKYILIPEKDDDLEFIFILFDKNLNVEVNLKDEETFAKIKVLYLVNKNQKLDIQIKMNHIAQKTSSIQEVKGVVKDMANVLFHGGILIKNEAQRADGYQNHRAFLLSDEAMVTAIPELEIYADDVKCTHGSAVGPLDKEGVFYLMSRGITKQNAERILIKSFINSLVPEEYQYITNDWIDTNV